jgi:IclR family acetate operon transcriptional repressor
VLARHGDLGVTEISSALDVHKSTVSRLLGTLEARGLVEQASHRGRYRLGYGVVQLAEGVSKKHDMNVVSRTVCSALAEDVGETVNVAVHEGRAIVTIDQVMGSSSVTTVNWVGQHNAMHSTSAGKVFLANMPRAELRTYLDEKLEPFTEFTIVDPAVMESELAAVRDAGYARTIDEQEVGLTAVAAPIRALDGRVIAALVVSGPTFRVKDAIPEIAERVLSAAAEISERNGYPKAG